MGDRERREALMEERERGRSSFHPHFYTILSTVHPSQQYLTHRCRQVALVPKAPDFSPREWQVFNLGM